MTKDEILDFIGRNPLAFLATVEGGAPRVRAVMTLRADGRGILFNTGAEKEMNLQIEANPEVEMAFYAPSENRQIRVRGRLEPMRDPETIAFVLAKLPFLASAVQARGEEILRPYVLRGGRATPWSMRTAFEPKSWTEL